MLDKERVVGAIDPLQPLHHKTISLYASLSYRHVTVHTVFPAPQKKRKTWHTQNNHVFLSHFLPNAPWNQDTCLLCYCRAEGKPTEPHPRVPSLQGSMQWCCPIVCHPIPFLGCSVSGEDQQPGPIQLYIWGLLWCNGSARLAVNQKIGRLSPSRIIAWQGIGLDVSQSPFHFYNFISFPLWFPITSFAPS